MLDAGRTPFQARVRTLGRPGPHNRRHADDWGPDDHKESGPKSERRGRSRKAQRVPGGVHAPPETCLLLPQHVEATRASPKLVGTAWPLLLAGTAPPLLDTTASAPWDMTPLLLPGTTPPPLAATFALSDHTATASACFNDAVASAGMPAASLAIAEAPPHLKGTAARTAQRQLRLAAQTEPLPSPRGGQKASSLSSRLWGPRDHRSGAL
ncbi:hypothetical protein P7K49_039518 [Saguinus oedipus]|uniref:Uncharacterized protein n=1 Tax=Saguinus oedipus TaxID=9490 RepID=A0ABQ9TC28_SAGOE|nr:hypothetical protein P7K49_039518 [Saguinus oedipus]